ncbi:MAG: winged helix-turn-helix domain-containing protein [Myxococcaceae bacterium]
MGGKTKVELAANNLRWAIFKGEFLDEYMPSEAELAQTLDISRVTLRAALTFLKAEGLVTSVPGVGWRATKVLNAVSFEVIARMFEELTDDDQRAMLLSVLEMRTRQVVGEVTSLVRARQPISRSASDALSRIRVAVHSQQYTDATLEMEDSFLAALAAAADNTPMDLAAYQSQRALALIRKWLHPTCRLKPMAALATSLVDAIDRHDPQAVELAYQACTLRNALYLDLADQRIARFQNGNTDAELQVG